MEMTYVLQPGERWEIDFKVLLNPKIPLDPNSEQGDYLAKVADEELAAYQKALAEQELVHPMLEGWNIESLTLKDYSLERCTTFSCVTDTNNIGYRILAVYKMVVNGKNAIQPLTINVSQYFTWWDKDVLWLHTFLSTFWQTSPVVGLSKITTITVTFLQKVIKTVSNWWNSLVGFVENDWYLLVALAVIVFLLYISRSWKWNVILVIIGIGIVVYMLHPKTE